MPVSPQTCDSRAPAAGTPQSPCPGVIVVAAQALRLIAQLSCAAPAEAALAETEEAA